MELGPQCHRISPEAKADWRREREAETTATKQELPDDVLAVHETDAPRGAR
jgi:hypothetical protein